VSRETLTKVKAYKFAGNLFYTSSVQSKQQAAESKDRAHLGLGRIVDKESWHAEQARKEKERLDAEQVKAAAAAAKEKARQDKAVAKEKERQAKAAAKEKERQDKAAAKEMERLAKLEARERKRTASAAGLRDTPRKRSRLSQASFYLTQHFLHLQHHFLLR
jgi:hypothetical protein